MTEALTIDGVRGLWRKREKGERLPGNWPSLISKYIIMKEKSFKKRPAQAWELKLINEAKTIRRALHVY